MSVQHFSVFLLLQTGVEEVNVMPRLKVTVRVNGNALRRAYVEHLVFGVGAGMYMTDDAGRVRDNAGDLGIDSATPNADIRIWCQNSVARVLDGRLGGIAVSQDKGIVNNSIVNLNTNAEQDDYYAILNRALLAYDVIFRQFRPFSNLDEPDFPLGRRQRLSDTKGQQERIEISYPSPLTLGGLAFVEPKSVSTGYPLLHLTDRATDGRLFGESGSAPTLLPSEMAHTLHFSRFTSARRQQIETDYIGWITNDLANGGTALHTPGAPTSPKVAYIEALDHFALSFAEFIRNFVQDGTSSRITFRDITPQHRQDFLAREVSGTPVTAPGSALGGAPIATLSSSGSVVPNPGLVGAGDDEGAIYGCIFIDFARRVGLLSAVNAYFQSAADGAISFGGYRNWIENNRPQRLPDLEAAQATWGL
jgi:hypothetical protein